MALFKSLVCLSLAVLSAAAPQCVTTKAAPAPAMPLGGLAPPPANLTLKHIALGFGIQNYTCAQQGGRAAANGALAMLYDVTDRFPGRGDEALSEEDFNKLTGDILKKGPPPLNFNKQSAEGRANPAFPGASATGPFPPDADLKLCKGKPLPFFGHHFFSSSNVPTFVSKNGELNMPVNLTQGVDAPNAKVSGQKEPSTVKWLSLTALDGAVGAKMVYRVLTAGGVSHGCKNGTGGDSSAYTTTYWFYG
ncbi:hypothetical protein HIM_07344 [Hirsutella minnesotensis 3608]|uniref:Malate dehydrogenase n=1 Tax=Hirsutella minnesotensis 3608 TaxID=1043627 RepID=A0A0F7ZN91_9HYPO|nr:hypothetical protein HIM_07344 [Hirsutella minnesotensis 3608]